MKTFISLCLAFVLTGCAIAQSVTPAAPLEQTVASSSLAEVTRADLVAAISAAKVANDTAGENCAQALMDWLGQAPAVQPTIAGAFSAFEALRIQNMRVSAGIPKVVHLACAPVVLDAQDVLFKLGLIAAKKAVIPLP